MSHQKKKKKLWKVRIGDKRVKLGDQVGAIEMFYSTVVVAKGRDKQ
jgi:hypothetical protein